MIEIFLPYVMTEILCRDKVSPRGKRIILRMDFSFSTKIWPRTGTPVAIKLFMSRQGIGRRQDFPVVKDYFMSQHNFGLA